MNIAIVILNWNGRSLLEEFLPSVVSYSREATIYMADNASTDDSIAFVQTHYPEVIIIQNDSNGGYAKGYNEALAHIHADVYCLLNSDVAVTEAWLTPIITTFEKRPDVAAIQPKILDYKNKDYFEYAGAAGGFLDKYGYPYCRGRIFQTLEKDTGQYNDTLPIFWASGACLFIRKVVFETVGKFDERYFAHQEEIDLCWRLHNQGHIILYVGTSTIFHLGGGTLDNMKPQKTFLNFRNSLFNLVKNAPGPGVWWLVFVRMILDGLAGLVFIKQGKIVHSWAILKAHFSFYRHLVYFIAKRKGFLKKNRYYRAVSVVWNYYVLKRRYF